MRVNNDLWGSECNRPWHAFSNAFARRVPYRNVGHFYLAAFYRPNDVINHAYCASNATRWRDKHIGFYKLLLFYVLIFIFIFIFIYRNVFVGLALELIDAWFDGALFLACMCRQQFPFWIETLFPFVIELFNYFLPPRNRLPNNRLRNQNSRKFNILDQSAHNKVFNMLYCSFFSALIQFHSKMSLSLLHTISYKIIINFSILLVPKK